MRKYGSFLLATLFLTGCPNFAMRSTGKAVIVLRPTYGAGSLSTKAEVPVYSKDTINHLVLKLFTVNGEVETPVLDGSGEVARDILKANLDSSIILGNLKANTTYRIRGYAYKAAGINAADLISDTSSYTDVEVLTDDRPTMAAIPVKLIDRNFAGLGTGSVAVTPGGYNYAYAEGFASYYNTVYRITTYAGVSSPDGTLATSTMVGIPADVAYDGIGNIYFADSSQHRVRKITADGRIYTIAGNGLLGYSGDGGPATNASLNYPSGVAADAAGNVYIADTSNHCIRKVVPGGTITTIAGNSSFGYNGDGDALNATLFHPRGLAITPSGLFIADSDNNRIRKLANGTLTTVAGNGGASWSGDNGPATSAALNRPFDVAVDGSGCLFIADFGNNLVRKVDTNGTITTFAGTGTQGNTGDGGAATLAQITAPDSVLAAGDGSIIFCDGSQDYIRKVALDGTISTIAGNGSNLFTGDGIPALGAGINPSGLALDGSGNILIADCNNSRVRKISGGTISTIAGIGRQGYGGGYYGDGGLAISAGLATPGSVFPRKNGEFLIADSGNYRLRKIGTDGRISSIAGNGTYGTSGDGGQANLAQINIAHVAEDAAGNIYLAGGNKVRKIAPDGIITTVAGNGLMGYVADGVLASTTKINATSIDVSTNGEIYLAEGIGRRIRKVDTNGIITTIAGTGALGFSGDGGPATAAPLGTPNDIVVDPSGNTFFIDKTYGVLRKIDTNGIITTIAGNGTLGYSGDGGPATAAQLKSPSRLALDAIGNFYILDAGNSCVRKITPAGIISTIAGPWTTGYSGDNGPAVSAQLNGPADIAVDRLGNVYLADTNNSVIRKLD